MMQATYFKEWRGGFVGVGYFGSKMVLGNWVRSDNFLTHPQLVGERRQLLIKKGNLIVC